MAGQREAAIRKCESELAQAKAQIEEVVKKRQSQERVESELQKTALGSKEAANREIEEARKAIYEKNKTIGEMFNEKMELT